MLVFVPIALVVLIFIVYRASSSARIVAEEKDRQITRLKETVQRQAQAIERSVGEARRRSDDSTLQLEELFLQKAFELDQLRSKICDYTGKANVHERDIAIRAVSVELWELLVHEQCLNSALVKAAFKGEPLVFYFEMAEEKGLHLNGLLADSDTSELINRCYALYEAMLSYLLEHLQLMQMRTAKETNPASWKTSREIVLQSTLAMAEEKYARYCSRLEHALAVGK